MQMMRFLAYATNDDIILAAREHDTVQGGVWAMIQFVAVRAMILVEVQAGDDIPDAVTVRPRVPWPTTAKVLKWSKAPRSFRATGSENR